MSEENQLAPGQMAPSQRQMYEKGLEEGIWTRKHIDFFFQGDINACRHSEEDEYQQRMQAIHDADEMAYWLGRITSARQSLQELKESL